MPNSPGAYKSFRGSDKIRIHVNKMNHPIPAAEFQLRRGRPHRIQLAEPVYRLPHIAG